MNCDDGDDDEVSEVVDVTSEKWWEKETSESPEETELEDAVNAICGDMAQVEESAESSHKTQQPGSGVTIDGSDDHQRMNGAGLEQQQQKSVKKVSKEIIRALPSMPLSETRFSSPYVLIAKDQKNKLSFGVFRCPLCPQDSSFSGATAFQAHLINDHYNIHLYGCHLCFDAFPSYDSLTKHQCQEFAAYTIGLLAADKKVELQYVMHTLVCAECNQIPLPSARFVSRKLINLMKVHNCDSLVSCLVYFAEQPNNIEYVTVHGIESKSSIPLSCKICDQKFLNVGDVEKHGVEHSLTKLKCAMCPRFFFSDLFYRDHLVMHICDQSSMIPIIETSTLLPPSWQEHGSIRMGATLERVRGPHFEICRMNGISDEVSDLEDVTIARDVLKRKKRSEKAAIDEKNSEDNKKHRRQQSDGNNKRFITCRQLC